MPETCGGFCCERFRIARRFGDGSVSHMEIVELANQAGPNDEFNYRVVADMLIDLGFNKLNGNGGLDAIPSHWFTCKHFDKTTRLCTIYETRPWMCRRHGGKEQDCIYDKCRFKTAKGGEACAPSE